MVKKSDNKFSIQKDGGTVPNKIFDYMNQNFENGLSVFFTIVGNS